MEQLEKALDQHKKDEDYFIISAAASKLFESSLEYAWKFLKVLVQQEGIEVYSPRDTFKQAGRLNLIDSVEDWLEFLDNRNLAVHDYLGISDKIYLDSIQKYLHLAKKLI